MKKTFCAVHFLVAKCLSGILCYMLLAPAVFAQVVIIKGEVRHLNTLEPVPFANIFIEGSQRGTSSNPEGAFELRVPEAMYYSGKSLMVTAIGFETVSTKLQRHDPRSFLEVRMKPQSARLDQVTIFAGQRDLVNQARVVVNKAFDRVPKNYADQNYRMETFYRHYCSENGIYGRLIEAAVAVQDNKGYRRHQLYPPEKTALQVAQLRRSFDFTRKSGHNHAPVSLNFILLQDIAAYSYRNYLLEQRNSFYFEVIDTTAFDGQPVLEIRYETTEAADLPGNRQIHGSLFINMADYAFLKVVQHEERQMQSLLDSSYQQVTKTTTYRKFGKHYLPNRMVSEGKEEFNVYDSLGQLLHTRNHTAHVEIMVNQVRFKDFAKIKGGEPDRQQLLQIDYDSAFWQGYTILTATPLEEEIVRDLSGRAPLEQQFMTYNVMASGGKSILESPAFAEAVARLKGKATYLVLWAGWSPPPFFLLQPGEWLQKQLKKNRVQIVLLAVEPEEARWHQLRELYQLNLPEVKHLRLPIRLDREIASGFYHDMFPLYILLDKNGEVVPETPLPPADPQLQQQILGLLR